MSASSTTPILEIASIVAPLIEAADAAIKKATPAGGVAQLHAVSTGNALVAAGAENAAIGLQQQGATTSPLPQIAAALAAILQLYAHLNSPPPTPKPATVAAG